MGQRILPKHFGHGGIHALRAALTTRILRNSDRGRPRVARWVRISAWQGITCAILKNFWFICPRRQEYK